MKIALLSGGFPPDLDGIGDHTWWLSRELAAAGAETLVVTSAGPERSRPPGVAVETLLEIAPPRQILGLPARLAALPGKRPDWLLLQYNPFSFGKYGFCPFLPRALAALQRSGVRLAPLFHETKVPLWPWRFTVMSAWQAPIFRRLCRMADASFVSTERWTGQVRRVAPQLECRHLPVGSNVALCDISRGEARRRLGIDSTAPLFGVFGQAHVTRLFSWIGAAAQALVRQNSGAAIAYVGPHGDRLRAECGGLSFHDLGVQPADSLGACLRAMDLVLSPYSDGVSTRRSSLTAALQHGIPAATTGSNSTDAVFQRAPGSLLLSSAKTARDFVDDVVTWWGARRTDSPIPDRELMDFYDREFSWERAADILLKTLRAVP